MAFYYAVKRTWLIALADQVRRLLGSSDKLTTDGMETGLKNTECGVRDYTMEDAILNKALTEYTNGRVTEVGPYAFYGFENLASGAFPAVTTIGTYAFYSCKKLASIDAPLVTKISNYAFCLCDDLASVSFPMATSVGAHALSACYALTDVSFPVLTSIGSRAFGECNALKAVDFPAVTQIGSEAFYSCAYLETVNFPVATSIGSTAFRGCKKLKEVKFPAVTSVGSNAFYECNALEKADFSATCSFSTNFSYCESLTALILRSETVCTYSSTGGFYNTPIAAGSGYIYVPAALVDTYKAAENWSAYTAQFRALEDYTVDGTITGELDESKI